MEDIRTSESLEKEVREDARKKAERVLKNAEKQIEDLDKEWTGRIEAELSALEKDFERRKTVFEKGIGASVPLEKSRKKLRFLEERFEEALTAYLSSLGEADTVELLSRRGADAAKLLGNPPHIVHFSGISREAAGGIAAALGARNAELRQAQGYRGIVLHGENGGVRFRLTLDEAAGELRERARRKIIEALFRGKY